MAFLCECKAVAVESATTETATSSSASAQFATKDDFFDFDEPENSQLIAVNKVTMECLRFLEEPCGVTGPTDICRQVFA